MAAIQNLEVVVDVDIAKALVNLEDLQSELVDLAETITEVDARGSEGIDIDTNLEPIDDDLAQLYTKLQAFENFASLTIGSNLGGGGGSTAADAVDDIKKPLTGPGFLTMSSPTAADPSDLSSGMGWMFGGRNKKSGLMERLTKRLGDGMESAIDGLRGFNIRMSDLHNAMAAMVPMLLVLVGSMPAVITAFGGLAVAAFGAAAALGAIAGFGALGMAMQDGEFSAERLQDVGQDIKDSFLEAFAPLAEQLQPLFEDSIDGLEMFFQATANQGDALMALTDEARGFGQFLIEFVPQFLRGIAGMVDAFGEVFGRIGNFLTNNVVDIFRELTRLAMDALPATISLVNTIIGALPGLIDLSIGFARVATAVISLFDFMGRLLTVFGLFSGEHMGLAIAALLSFASIVALTNALIGLFSETVVASAVSAMTSFVATTILGAESFAALSLATQIATASLIAFVTVATLGAAIGLAGMAIGAAQEFLGLSASIDSAASSMRDFNRVSGRGDSGPNPYEPSGRRGGGSSYSGGSGGTTVNIESTGDKQKDKSNAKYAGFRLGRTSGSTA